MEDTWAFICYFNFMCHFYLKLMRLKVIHKCGHVRLQDFHSVFLNSSPFTADLVHTPDICDLNMIFNLLETQPYQIIWIRALLIREKLQSDQSNSQMNRLRYDLTGSVKRISLFTTIVFLWKAPQAEPRHNLVACRCWQASAWQTIVMQEVATFPPPQHKFANLGARRDH